MFFSKQIIKLLEVSKNVLNNFILLHSYKFFFINAIIFIINSIGIAKNGKKLNIKKSYTFK